MTTGNVKPVNPMASVRPTGMGNAGYGLCLAFGVNGISEACYMRVNDGKLSRLSKILVRWWISEKVMLENQNALLIFATHHAPILSNGRRIVVVHDLICVNHFKQSPIQAFVFVLCAPLVAVSASVFVAISNNAAAEWNKRFGCIRKVDAVIPSISSFLNELQPGRNTLAERRRFGQVLFVGGNYRHKALDFAIDVVRCARSSGLAVQLLVVGTDWSVWEHSIGLSDVDLRKEGIVIERYCTSERLREEYQRSICLFFPSKEEGLGFPPLEAAACGCPVICNNLPVLIEIAGSFADFVETGDVLGGVEAIHRLFDANYESVLDSKIEAGLMRAECFRASRIENAWKKLLAGISLNERVI